ncbi:hypothetical protein [Halococcoides cellulosivorans]|uniref:hypothetical protein n=1 Tax=Halococcoides cellulosivorans TaxID=1679096 RepID=UPI00131F226E|nr:hypothetical protein [Halococcoides cellulosivorans]
MKMYDILMGATKRYLWSVWPVILLFGAVIALFAGDYATSSLGLVVGGLGAVVVMILDHRNDSGSYVFNLVSFLIILFIIFAPAVVWGVGGGLSVVIAALLVMLGSSVRVALDENTVAS